MAQKYVNNAYSTLASTIGTGDTSITVSPGRGDRWPEIAAPNYCYTTLEDALGNIEIVKVTARAAGSDVLTVTRAQQGTTARAWNLGDLVELRVTAIELTAFETDIDNLEASRAKTAGDTYTGTHDMTGAVLEVADQTDGDNTSKAANTKFVYRGLSFKANLDSPTFTGTVTIPAGANIAGYAPLASPVFTGIPRGTTAAFGASGTQLATLDFVNAVSFASALPGQTGNAGKVLKTDGANASWDYNSPDLPLMALGIV